MTNFDEIRKRAEAIRQIPVEAMRKQDIAQLRVDNRRLIAEVERVVGAIDKAETMHPYKVSGERETFMQYNEGWQDAVDYIGSHIRLRESDEPQKNTAEAVQTK